jgi:prepilin-type N-terminal cleavage/methylation domain-containing protein
MRSRASSQAGFSLIEIVVAMTILVIASGTAVVLTNSVLPGIRADSQGRRLIAMMQYARGMATSSRRDVELRFDVPANTAQLVLMDAGVERPLQRLDLEYHVEFTKFPGLGDTPDGFGDADVIDFGGATRIVFEPDGSVIDETGLPVNGTVFLGMDGEVHAARAITLTGTTGRARMYHWSSAATPSGGWRSSQ